MKVTFQKEDIQLLASILQEQLLLELPSVPVIQVKCAIQNDELMVLTQHPPGVTVDTEKIFTILEESLQWQSQYHHERVQFYVRVSGEKLPYAKHSIIIEAKGIQEDNYISLSELSNASHPGTGKNQLIFPPLEIPGLSSTGTDENISDNPFREVTDHHLHDHLYADTSFSSLTNNNIADNLFSSQNEDEISDTTFGSDNSFSSHTTFNSDTTFLDDRDNELANELPEEEKFDPFAGGQNLSKKKTLSLPSLPPIPILLGGVLGVAVLFGGGAFFLSRACVIGACPALNTAEQFQGESQQLLRRAKSKQELLGVQQQLDQAISDLQVIPQWSPRYQPAQELTLSFSERSTKIKQVVKALQTGSAAEEKNQTPATSLDELRSRQTLWRQAITPLESIKPNHELYALVQTNLPKYKSNLQAINQQLLDEEAWQKKLATAKNVAESANKRQINAKSGNDWQRVQFAWQEVVNNLKSIPKTSAAYQEAQSLLVDYQPRFVLARNISKREIAAAKIYQQAVNFASQAKKHEAQNQWQAAVASWQQALQTAKQISADTSNYSQAQLLIQPYSNALTQAQTKQQLYGNLAQTRADLGKTCVNGMRFCTFTIENQGIIVRLTPEYEKALQNGNPDIQSHLQTLQQALGVISENANLAVFLYNSQGEERYMKRPE